MRLRNPFFGFLLGVLACFGGMKLYARYTAPDFLISYHSSDIEHRQFQEVLALLDRFGQDPKTFENCAYLVQRTEENIRYRYNDLWCADDMPIIGREQEAYATYELPISSSAEPTKKIKTNDAMHLEIQNAWTWTAYWEDKMTLQRMKYEEPPGRNTINHSFPDDAVEVRIFRMSRLNDAKAPQDR